MTDCIVIGGGLIGMLSARELKKAGMDVLVLDKGGLGQESSWAGGGILSPLHPWNYSDEVNELASIGHQVYPQLAKELFEESGIDPEYYRCGMLVLQSREQQISQQSRVLSWADRWKMQLFSVDSLAEMKSIAPGLSAAFEQGVWLPDVAQMRNPRLVKAIKGSMDRLGIHYKENMDVKKINIKNGKVKGVVTPDREINADQVLVAGGAWTAALLKGLRQVPDIAPVKGQMIIYRGQPGLLNTILLAENRYLIPRKDGRILCGSTIEHSGFDKSTSETVGQKLQLSAVELFPGLAELPVEHHWSGLRPGSPAGEPYILRHNEIEGLYINAGHYRNGVILGIGSAQRISKMMISDR